jgi:hypothetical protein
MVVKLQQGIKTSSKQIRGFMKKTGIYDVYSFLLHQAKKQLDQAYSEYKAAKKEANSWQVEFQDSLMVARAKKNDTTMETELKKQKQNK